MEDDPDNTIAIGPVEITKEYQFAFYVEGRGQFDTVMTPQEHGIVSRVVRRAIKEYNNRKENDDRDDRATSLEETKA